MDEKSLKKPKKPKKSPRSGKPVLSGDEQLKVCLWIAWFKKDTEIIKLIKKEFKKTITYSTLNKTYRNGAKWQNFIIEERSKYLKDLTSVPIANSKVRLERLEKIYQEAMTWRVSVVNQFGVIKKIDLTAAVQALRDAKVEMKGEDEEDWGDEEIELFEGNNGNGNGRKKAIENRFARFLN